MLNSTYCTLLGVGKKVHRLKTRPIFWDSMSIRNSQIAEKVFEPMKLCFLRWSFSYCGHESDCSLLSLGRAVVRLLIQTKSFEIRSGWLSSTLPLAAKKFCATLWWASHTEVCRSKVFRTIKSCKIESIATVSSLLVNSQFTAWFTLEKTLPGEKPSAESEPNLVGNVEIKPDANRVRTGMSKDLDDELSDTLDNWTFGHEYIWTYKHPHIYTSRHLYIQTSRHLDLHTSAHLHIYTSTHLDIWTSVHPDTWKSGLVVI